MKRGYARISTIKQNNDRQLHSLKEVGCEVIYEDVISGVQRNRPELDRMLEELEPGDEIWIHDISRFSRSLKDLLEMVEIISEKGCSLHSISERWLDTSEDNPSAKLLLNIFGSLAEFEREMIKIRQQEGIAVAKINGKYRGRKPEWTEENSKLKRALQWFQEGDMTVKEITEITGVSKSTLYRIAQAKGIKRGE